LGELLSSVSSVSTRYAFDICDAARGRRGKWEWTEGTTLLQGVNKLFFLIVPRLAQFNIINHALLRCSKARWEAIIPADVDFVPPRVSATNETRRSDSFVHGCFLYNLLFGISTRWWPTARAFSLCFYHEI